MGASKEKKKRLEEKNSGVDKKREAREKEASAAKKTKRRNYIIAGVCLLVAVLILFFTSNFFYRSFDAVKVGNTGYSAPEYKYFYYDTYMTAYRTLYDTYGEYASYFMPDEDTLKEATFENMRLITMLYDEAKNSGFELPDEAKENIEVAISELDQNAKENGFSGINSYLAGNYGKGMNKNMYRKCMERSYIASYYYTEVYDSFEYSDEELRSYYAENKDDFDRITFYSRFFDGSAVEDDEETEEDETVTKEEAMAAAKENAEAYADGIVYEKFKVYSEPVTSYGNNIDSVYAGWLKEADRQEGDYTIVETEDGYYVVCFVSRDDNDYDTVNVRHILIMPETIDSTAYDTDEAYQEALDAADEAAKLEAEEIYDSWLDGDATEESFAALADEKSADSPEGGLYENIFKGQMVTEFEDWCFEAHEAGDTGIVKTAYGYHIMYFSGIGENYQLFAARSNKNSADYNAWQDEKLESGYDLRTTAVFKLAQ